jgi:hypothetical protein
VAAGKPGCKQALCCIALLLVSDSGMYMLLLWLLLCLMHMMHTYFAAAVFQLRCICVESLPRDNSTCRCRHRVTAGHLLNVRPAHKTDERSEQLNS